MHTFAQNLGVRVIHVDASDEFLGALAGVADPEAKRKIIGKLFVDVFQREAAKLPNVKWLAQGTIYPDVIESAGAKTKKAHTIKSHHNVGGLPETLHLKLLEPLRELFKDEVRELGLELGLPRDMVFRHPFPGPGLGVRILGEVTPRARGSAAPRRRDLHRRAARRARRRRQVLVRQDGAGVRRVPAGALRRRDGRRAHLRECGRAARRADHRLHDRALGAPAARAARAHLAIASPTKCAASTAWCTTSRASRRRRSSGSDRVPSVPRRARISFRPSARSRPTASTGFGRACSAPTTASFPRPG